MKIIKFFVALVLALAFEQDLSVAHAQFEQASSMAHAEDAVAQPTLSGLVTTARQTLALKAMTVPQLLARVQLPAISWSERHQIVEELRVRPAREVLPLLYQVLTARGPWFNGWGSDPYIYGGHTSWNEQASIVLDRAWSYQVGAVGETDLDTAYYALAEQPYSEEKTKTMDELEKRREEDHKKRHQEVGHVLLDILRKDKVKKQTVRLMEGLGYCWTEQARPDVIAVCGDTKTDSGIRWWALNTLLRWSYADDYAAIVKARRDLPVADKMDCLEEFAAPSDGYVERQMAITVNPDFQVLRFGFDLLKQVVAAQGAQSENAVKIATELAEYAKVNFAPNAPADLIPQHSIAELEQHNKEIADYDKTLVQPALDWWQHNAVKYQAQSK